MELKRFSDMQNAVTEFISNFREHKLAKFLHVSDGLSAIPVQVVLPGTFEGKINVGSAVQISGTIQKSIGKEQPLDLLADKVSIISDCDRKNYPFASRKKQTPDTLRRYLHLRPKTKSFSAFLRLRSRVKHIINTHLQERDFVLIDTPILTRNDCESAGEAFLVTRTGDSVTSSEMSNDNVEKSEFFDSSVYLTVSGQLHLEAVANSLKQVYTFGPSFRAESSLSRQHLAEFYMLEVEKSFCNNLDDIISVVEKLITSCIKNVLASCAEDLAICQKYHESNTTDILSRIAKMDSFPKITFDEAVFILTNNGHTFEPGVRHISKKAEQYLVSHFNNEPLFVTHYPSHVKPFYMKRTDCGSYAICFDLLMPNVGEVCGGSLRECKYDVIADRIGQMSSGADLQWYADLRNYGYANLGGFGLGFERLLQFIAGIYNIKDCTAFPRWFKHCAA